MSTSTMGHGPEFTTDCWYVVATSEQVNDQTPTATRALNTALVLWRDTNGQVACLEDRDAHRPYPLSLGATEDGQIVSGYSGFRYDSSGACVHVPTQESVPYGASVRAFPVVEQDGWVWAWFGTPGLARLHRAHRCEWLEDDGWDTFGDEWTTAAGSHLLHENFADITHVAVVAKFIAPPALSGPVPVLDVTVSESQVRFARTYEAAAVSEWQAPLMEVDPEDRFTQHETGEFVSPALWVNSWTVDLGQDTTATFRFTHGVTPIDAATTRHFWRVSRDFAPGADISANLEPLFVEYYSRVKAILETMQGVLDRDGERREVNVTADAAALQVRKILTRLAENEAR